MDTVFEESTGHTFLPSERTSIIVRNLQINNLSLKINIKYIFIVTYHSGLNFLKISHQLIHLRLKINIFKSFSSKYIIFYLYSLKKQIKTFQQIPYTKMRCHHSLPRLSF